MEDFTDKLAQCQIQIRAVIQALLPEANHDLRRAVVLEVLARYTAESIRDKEVLNDAAYATDLALDLVARVRVHVNAIRHP